MCTHTHKHTHARTHVCTPTHIRTRKHIRTRNMLYVLIGLYKVISGNTVVSDPLHLYTQKYPCDEFVEKRLRVCAWNSIITRSWLLDLLIVLIKTCKKIILHMRLYVLARLHTCMHVCGVRVCVCVLVFVYLIIDIYNTNIHIWCFSFNLMAQVDTNVILSFFSLII